MPSVYFTEPELRFRYSNSRYTWLTEPHLLFRYSAQVKLSSLDEVQLALFRSSNNIGCPKLVAEERIKKQLKVVIFMSKNLISYLSAMQCIRLELKVGKKGIEYKTLKENWLSKNENDALALILILFCSPCWTWTSDPLINSQML